MNGGITSSDCQKSKLLVMFSALGMGGFILSLLAGVVIWRNILLNANPKPTYDEFITTLGRTPPDALPDLAKLFFENWSRCAATLEGMNSVVVHALITGSVAGIFFFLLCMIFGWQLYKKIDSHLKTQN